MDRLKNEIVRIIEYSPGLSSAGDTPSLHNDFDVVIDDNSINILILPGSMFDLSKGVDDLYNRMFSILSFYLHSKYQLYKKYKAIVKFFDSSVALSFPYRKGHYCRITQSLNEVLDWDNQGIPLQLFKSKDNYSCEFLNPYSQNCIDGSSRTGKTTFLLYLMRVMLHLNPFGNGSFVYAIDPKLSRLGLFIKQHNIKNAKAIVPNFNSGVGSDFLQTVNDTLGRLINIEKQRQKIIWDNASFANGVDWRTFHMKPIFCLIDEVGLLSKMSANKMIKVFRNRLDYLASTSQGFGIFLSLASQSLSVVNANVSTLVLGQAQNLVSCGLPSSRSIVPSANLVMLPNESYVATISLNGIVEPLLLPSVMK